MSSGSKGGSGSSTRKGTQPSERSAGEAQDNALVKNYRAYRKAAQQGDAVAQCNLGISLQKGDGVAKNREEAVVWIRKAAEQGVAEAQWNLGVCLQNGEGVAQDAAQALVWYRKAAEQGDAKAQWNLGVCLYKGEGITPAQDAEQAVVWIRKAAEQGVTEAQNALGSLLLTGDGVARDAAQALVWYRKAAEQGNAQAQSNLGIILLEGAEGVPQDVKAGARSLAAAAQQRHAEALGALAARAGNLEVAKACCLGCGATTNLQACSRCHVARFCSKACVVCTWPVHKPHCKRWQAEAQAAAESSA